MTQSIRTLKWRQPSPVGQLEQHWLTNRVFRRLNGVTAAAPGPLPGHAMGLRLRSTLAKAGSLCPGGQQVACINFSDVGCKSPKLTRRACVHACIRDRIMSHGRTS